MLCIDSKLCFHTSIFRRGCGCGSILLVVLMYTIITWGYVVGAPSLAGACPGHFPWGRGLRCVATWAPRSHRLPPAPAMCPLFALGYGLFSFIYYIAVVRYLICGYLKSILSVNAEHILSVC